MDPEKALFEIKQNAAVFWNPSTPKDTRLSLAEHIIEHAEALADWVIIYQGYVPKEKEQNGN